MFNPLISIGFPAFSEVAHGFHAGGLQGNRFAVPVTIEHADSLGDRGVEFWVDIFIISLEFLTLPLEFVEDFLSINIRNILYAQEFE